MNAQVGLIAVVPVREGVLPAGGLEALAESGAVNVVDGPGPRFGARGQGTALYVSDPDGLTVELRCY